MCRKVRTAANAANTAAAHTPAVNTRTTAAATVAAADTTAAAAAAAAVATAAATAAVDDTTATTTTRICSRSEETHAVDLVSASHRHKPSTGLNRLIYMCTVGSE